MRLWGAPPKIRGAVAALGLLSLLSACATQPTAPRPGGEIYPRPPLTLPGPSASGPSAPTPGPALIAVSELPGWASDDHLAALRAFQATCGVAQEPRARDTCLEARRLSASDGAAARRFFESRFRAEPMPAPGLLTGYFAPEYEARLEPDEIFSAPIRPAPEDLVRGADGRFRTYLTRAEIETTPGPALAFMRPEDLFFMQIQGSGYLTFADGRRAHAAYAADNGQPFVGIARPLVERGLLEPRQTSGEGIRAWLAAHRGPEAQAITDLDPRYVFFSLAEDNQGHPLGAAGLPLPPGRAAAVDRQQHGFGELLWIDADGATLAGAAATYRRLVVALDSGGAIRGPARVDLYFGRGPEAGAEAGRVKHPLRLYRLVPGP